jgi:exosortase
VSESESAATASSRTTAWLVLAGLLWAQLYFACIYGWRYGEYYGYGWYVPPLVILFFYRLRHFWQAADPPALAIAPAVAASVLLFACLAVLRTLNRVDPRWTLPLWLQAGIVIATTFFALHRLGGMAAVRRFVPVIAFACSAIPLPSVLEYFLVSNLTDSVIAASVRVLEWSGQPVHAIGDQLGRLGEVVHVTEGCSGIKSAQSFLMTALFFGEWMALRRSGRWLIILAGLATAWTLNVLRASVLAWIRFEHGTAAFEDAHDLAGLLAFALGSLVLLSVSRLLDGDRQGRRIVRRSVERRPA